MIINVAKATEAAGVLGVELDTLSPDALGDAYRAKTKLCHPDVCHNPELWARVSWAKEVLTHWLKNRPAAHLDNPEVDPGDCRACGGVGRIATGKPSGFKQKAMTVMCVMCNGSGTATPGPRGFYGGSDG